MTDLITKKTFEELTPGLQDRLRARVERLGYLGEFFRVAGHQPDILEPFLDLTVKLKEALPERLTETGALTVAKLMDNSYELYQHERLAQKLGFDVDWIAAVEQVAPDHAPLLSDAERAVQRVAIAMVRERGQGAQPLLNALIAQVGVEQAVAIMFLVGRYTTHAMIVNALGLQPPVASIFGRST